MRALIVVIAVVTLLLPGLWAGQKAGSKVARPDPQFSTQRNDDAPDRAKIERDMAKQRNKERQQQIKKDTDQLLKLATELKEYVDKTNENILSVDVLKKTDEIDRLAKSIRDKMKEGSYDGLKYPEVNGGSSQ